MRLHSIDKKGIIYEIFEAENMFKENGSFRKDFLKFWKNVVENNHDVVFSTDNRIKKIIIIRRNKSISLESEDFEKMGKVTNARYAFQSSETPGCIERIDTKTGDVVVGKFVDGRFNEKGV